MIKYNLKEDNYKNHPMDNKYGIVITNTPYAGYPLTIVDNYEEVVNGRYTDTPTICLLHLSEDVRQYTRLKLFNEFLYISFVFSKPTYKMYEYKLTQLQDEEVVKILKNVLYNIQPKLQGHSCVAYKSNLIEDDGNYYEGIYVLNDEEEYTILKCKDKYKFYKGRKSYYPDWKKIEGLLYEGDINFMIYKLAIEVYNLRSIIVTKINSILDNKTDDISKYYKLKSELDMRLDMCDRWQKLNPM